MAASVVRAVDAAVAEACARAAMAAPPGAKLRHLSAEELIPLIVIIATRARLRRPHAAIAYMATYGLGGTGGGRADYCVCTLQLAVAWTCTQRAARVGVGAGGGRLEEPRAQQTDPCAVRRVTGTPGKAANMVDNNYFAARGIPGAGTGAGAGGAADFSPLKPVQRTPPPSRNRSTAVSDGEMGGAALSAVLDGFVSVTGADDAADELAYGVFADTLLSGGGVRKNASSANKGAEGGEVGGGGDAPASNPTITRVMSLADFAAALGSASSDAAVADGDKGNKGGGAGDVDVDSVDTDTLVDLGFDGVAAAAEDADVASAELYASLALENGSALSARSNAAAALTADKKSPSASKRLFDALRRIPPPARAPQTSVNHISALRELVAEQDALEGAIAVLD